MLRGEPLSKILFIPKEIRRLYFSRLIEQICSCTEEETVSSQAVQRARHCVSLWAEDKNTDRHNTHKVDVGTMHVMHAVQHPCTDECVVKNMNVCKHSHCCLVYMRRAAALLWRLAGTFVMVVLLFHIKQNATALHTAPLISASVTQAFIFASHLLSSSAPPNVALIASQDDRGVFRPGLTQMCTLLSYLHAHKHT